MKKKRELIEKLSSHKLRIVLYVLFAVLFALPTLKALCFVIPAADDFANASIIENLRNEHTYIGAALSFDKNIYMTHQGTYFGCLLVGLLPSWRSTYFFLRAFLVVGTILLVISSAFLMYEICRKFIGISNRISTFLLMILSEYIVLNTADFRETLTWFNGACLYCYPLVCFLVGAAFLIRSQSEKGRNRNTNLCVSALLALLGSGGSLMVTGTGCWMFMVITLVMCIEILKKSAGTKSDRIKELLSTAVPFVSGFIGALINVIAPGNYARHDAYVNELGFGETTVSGAIVKSINQLIDEWNSIRHGEYALIVIMVIAFVVVILVDTEAELNIRAFIGISLLLVATPLIACFPIFYGEGISVLGEYRTIYMFKFALEFSLIFSSICSGVLIKSIISRNNKQVENRTQSKLAYGLIMSTFLLLFVCSFAERCKDGMTVRVLSELRSGIIQKNTAAWDFIYTSLEQMEPQTNLIVIELPEESIPDICMYSNPISSPKDWVNKCIASYYGHTGSFKINMQ